MADVELMRRAGAKMANTMFNLAQQVGDVVGITAKMAVDFKEMQREWDEAVRTPSSSHPVEGERQSIDTPEFRQLVTACGYDIINKDKWAPLITHIDTWASRSAGDAVPAEQKQADESNVLPPFAAPASRVHFDDATIESAALKHVATDWHLISHLIPNYRCTEQFARLKAFAEELASGFREGRNAKPETSSGAAHLVEQVGEPGAWQVLSMADIPDPNRKLDVVLTNGVMECDRDYSRIDWTQVADWRYSHGQDSANESAEGSGNAEG
jgi:hypothetical protein